MIALATGTYSVLRGTVTNAYGDEVDGTTVVAAGVPMSLLAASQSATGSTDARAQEVERLAGRAPKGTDIRVGDRIRDDRTPTEVYLVTGSHQAANPILAQDLALTVTRVPTT